MFAFFGLGTQEILLLGLLGGAVAVIVLVVFTARASGGAARPASDGIADRVDALEQENRRLRAEVDELRRKGGGAA
jgi:hypothetical protein